MKYSYLFFQSCGLSGWLLDLMSGLLFTILFLTVIPFLGSLVRRFAQWQIGCLSKITGSRFAEWVCNRLLFPGTVVHELSHALFAAASGAKVLKVRCLTLFSKDTLGYVQFQPRGNPLQQSFQMTVTGCSPTVTGIFLLWLMGSLWSFCSLPVQVIFVYLGISIADHMSMSPSDVQNYRKGCPLLFVFVLVLSVGFCHFCMV